MRFAALLSGGKDSCYSVVQCQRYGHELVCVANLHPPEEVEELNSFMYQSAAASAIPAQAACFGVPLVRREISGTAMCQTLDYKGGGGDEVEDLLFLLQEIKERFPEVEAVSCGAILSTYQRLRVEDVCQRLKLTVLSPLWQRDQAQLLDEMLEAGIEAVLVKVAGAGLEPQKHLGKTLKALRPTLQNLHAKFGLDLCGEGGEYETLVLDCPAFSRRLVLDATEVLVDDEDCSVGNLRVLSCHAEDKPSSSTPLSPPPSPLPAALSLLVQEIGSRSQECRIERLPNDSLPRAVLAYSLGIDGLSQTAAALPRSLHFSLGQGGGGAEYSAAAQRQTAEVMEALRRCVEQGMRGTFSDAVFVHLYVSDMALFAAVNAEYCKFFGRNPPSRACVAVPLPAGVLVCADCTVLLDSDRPGPALDRRATLHVKSTSEWAPMCIGPYAQSNTLCGHVVFVAGQIPLDAATMTVWRPLVGGRRHEVAAQLALSLQHALNVLGVQNSAVGKAVGVTVYVNAGAVAELVEDLAWIGQCCCELLDALASNKALRSSHSSSRGDSDSDEDSNDDDEGDEEGEEKAAAVRHAWPVLVVGVGGIPRDCLVEVELLALTHLTRSASLLRATSTVSEAVSSIDAEHDAALLPRIEEWPLWSPRGAATANEPAAAASAPAASAAVSGSIVKISTSSATWPRCLSSAMCHASSASADASAPSLAAALVREMRRLVSAAGLAPSSLRWVRVYYPEAVWTREHVVAAVSTALEAFVPQFPICFVPVLGAVVGSSETRATPSSTLALHFCVLSLLQMRTEAWLAKAGR